jgi:hypothetical protein
MLLEFGQRDASLACYSMIIYFHLIIHFDFEDEEPLAIADKL